MPAGVFSLVHGDTPAVGLALVRHPSTRAVGFTGSLRAGRTLFDAAAARRRPIPVFAEMGSLNPVFLLPRALRARREEIAQRLAQSMTLGIGQFCTKPGLAVGLRSAELSSFTETLATAAASMPPGAMLYSGIADRYRSGVEHRRRNPDLRVVGAPPPLEGTNRAAAVVFATEARAFLEAPSLNEELFGPATLVVACESRERLEEVARRLEGQLTVTIHGTDEDLREHTALLDVLREKAGRLVFGGVPTGVEVVSAMQHGGPYPATTDPRFTSVGTAAILRFARPVCYQDSPQEWLPAELKDENPRGIWRLVDGQWTRAPLADVPSSAP